MSELATELSRRIDKEHVKEFAHEKAAELKEKAKTLATDKADELKHHAKEVASEKATEIKDRAREAVMTKTTQIRDRADTSKGWSVLGALLGAGVGSLLMKKAFDVREERSEGDGYLSGRGEYGGQNWGYGAYDRRDDVRPYDVRTATGNVDTGDLSTSATVGESRQGLSMQGDAGFEGGGVNLRDRASDATSAVKDKAVEVKDRVMDKAHAVRDRAMHLRDRLPDQDELRGRAYQAKGRASDWFDRTLEEQPLLLALGGIAVGMLASSLVPVSRRERRLMEPAKHRVEERISELGDRITDKIKGASDQGQSASDTNIGGSGMGITSSSSLGVSSSGSNLGLSSDPSVSGTGIDTGIDRSADLSSPTGSRIPPLPPLDDLTKVH
jgi:F0F1-type ATP synthase assembly protein I